MYNILFKIIYNIFCTCGFMCRKIAWKNVWCSCH